MNTQDTAAPVSATKQEICSLLRAFVNQRPGLDFANYGDASTYRSELRGITRQRKEALELLRACELRDSITAEDMREGFRAFSGRLSLVNRYKVNGKGAFYTLDAAKKQAEKHAPAVVSIEAFPALEYCAGQYFPTEYRAAVAAVCASVLWAYMRECMPVPVVKQYGKAGEPMETVQLYDGLRAGEWLRRHFRREFGRGIQSRWFN